MAFEILGEKYCCALIASGKMDKSDALLTKLAKPEWVKKQGEFLFANGQWNLAVGVATLDEEFRQDNDIKDFAAEAFGFLHRLSQSDEAKMTLHLHYQDRTGAMAILSPDALSILGALRIEVRIVFENEKSV